MVAATTTSGRRTLGETDIDDAYLKESVDCARAGFIRAAAVMGCAPPLPVALREE